MKFTDLSKKWKHRLYAAAAGAILAMGCAALPPDYHLACQTVLKVCTGGLINE